MVVQCCACKRVRVEDGWVDPMNADATPRAISHGYCPPCAEKAIAEFDVVLAMQQLPPAA